MATLTITYEPTHTASPLRGRAAQEEVPSFLETTIRVSAAAVALYYAGLAIAAYPLVGTATAIISSLVLYSNFSGIPVQDLIDKICDWCTPSQPVRRNYRQVNVPSVQAPVQATATLTVPVSLVRRSNGDEPSISGSSLRGQSPERTRLDSSVSGNEEFVIVGRFPGNSQGAIFPGLLDSQILYPSSNSDKKL